MGLLDSMPQQSAMPQASGLLGGTTQAPQAMPQPAAPQAQGMQMIQQLMKSPTPQTVQMVVGELMKKGTPEAKQIADVLTQVQSSPEGIAKVAQTIMQHMQGGQAAPTDQMGQ